MQDHAGNLVSEASEIAEIFAMFYERLYKSQLQPSDQISYDSASTVEPVSLNELQDALRVMKRGRAKDEAGIIDEMLKDGSERLLVAVLDLLNDVISFRQQPPSEWKLTKLVIIFKERRASTSRQLQAYCDIVYPVQAVQPRPVQQTDGVFDP